MSRFGWLISVLTPTFSQALCLWLGLLAVVFVPSAWGAGAVILVAALALLFAFLLPFQSRWVLPVLLAAVLGRFLFGALDYQQQSERRLALHDQKTVLTGKVVAVKSHDKYRQLFVFEPDSGDLAGEQLRVSWYRSDAEVRAGDSWRLPLKLKAPRSFRNASNSDYEHWFYHQGWLMNAYVSKGPVERLKAAGEQTLKQTLGVRQFIAQQFNQALFGEPYAGVLLALATADKSGIETEHWEQFRRLGLSHLLAISGLHIGIVAALGFGFGRLTWRWLPIKLVPRPRVELLAALLFAAVYASLADWTLPTQRAFIMLLALSLPSFLLWPVSVWQRLGIALVAVLLWDPWAVLSPGFYLSFYAVTILILAATNRTKPAGWWAWLVELFRFQCILSLALAPLTIAAFQELPLAGLMVNLLMIPVFSLILVPGVLLAVLLCFIPAGGLLAEWLWLLHAVLERLLIAFSSLGLEAWSVQFPSLHFAWVLLAVISVALAIIPWPFKIRLLLVCGFLPLFFITPVRPALGELWVTMLDVGQGQALHIQTADGNWLYDTGPKLGNVDAGSIVIEPYLRQLGLAPNGVFVSHDDNDHAGGYEYLKQRYPGMSRIACLRGDGWQAGQTVFTVLHPPENYRETDNNLSCVVLVGLAGHSLLLTGDIESLVEQELIERYPKLLANIDVLTMPHHGSRTSSSQAFVALTGPNIALVSAGWRNRFGHPKEEVLDRYRRMNTRIYRTDIHGNTQIRMARNGEVSVVLYSEQALRPWWRH